ncbi:MAG: O-methyltransferase [Bellilinea sp.]|nr:MAG: O-methyltransferase [Bellilinea sp.]
MFQRIKSLFSSPAADQPKPAEQWTAVDEYLTGLLLPADPALDQALRVSQAAGLPSIQVSPLQGKLLHLLAKSIAARRILEIGTLGGYSTIWLARALPPDGVLITLELDPKHAAVARENLAGAGVSERVEIHLGQALDSLARLVEQNQPPFDLIFIDADKPNYPAYFDWSLKLSRPGTLIVADNIIRKGRIIEPHSGDANVQGMRRFLERVAAEPRVSTAALQTVGSKGYDGFALILVES